MNAVDAIRKAQSFPLDNFLATVDSRRVERTLEKSRLALDDLLVLLSEPAADYLEIMANRAAQETRKHFGNVIFIFTPLYISNYCDNSCPYCSFARDHTIARRQLSLEDVRAECEKISDQGIRHILVLTGEARTIATPEYVAKSLAVVAERFSSVGIEVYPMSNEEYGLLVETGVDSLTIYQETYDRTAYVSLHEGGPKADYQFRLEAPDRACQQGIRAVTIGALLGLNSVCREMYSLAHHALYLQRRYPDVEISLSFPRLRPLVADFDAPVSVSERTLAQIITAFRLMFPYMGITLSTRETRAFRDGMLPLGITKMSAGVSTAVGGHTEGQSTTQFEIADTRSVDEMRADLLANGFQPVMHDWHRRLVAQA